MVRRGSLRCSGAALPVVGMPCFSQWGCTGALRARAATTAATMHPTFSNNGNSYAQLWQNKADSIATHAFCVRVRFKLSKTQAVARPSASLARGASRPSVPSQMRSPLSQRGLQRGLHRAGCAKRASVTNPSERAWIPRRDTARAAFTASKAAC